MAKMTLLDMTQKILSSMDSDEVNSIGDTTESLQVSEMIEETYFFLIDNKMIPELEGLLQLTALGDTDHPSHMQVPDASPRIDWIKYDTVTVTGNTPDWNTIPFVHPVEFLSRSNSRNPTDATVQAVSDLTSGSTLLIKNDQAPSYWTSFDDEYIVFDSFDSEVDTTLQASKTMVFGKTTPAWQSVDTFIPDLDGNMFSLLLNEAKSQCFIELKQVSNSNSEKRARKQTTRIQNDKFRVSASGNPADRLPNYGRGR